MSIRAARTPLVRSRSASRATGLAAAAAMALLSACGSTVAAGPSRAGAGLDAAGLPLPTQAEILDGSPVPTSSAPAGGPQQPGPESGRLTPVGPSAGTDVGADPVDRVAQRGSAVGVTDTTVNLGFQYAVNASGRAAALGVQSTPTSSQLILKALTAEINSSGGLAGRKLVLVPHPFDEQSAEPYDQQMQKACTAWTEDNKVYAAVQAGAMMPNLIACLKSKGVLAVTAPATSNLGTASFQRYSNYNEVTGANLDRLATLLAVGHHQNGYYKALGAMPVKVGLIRADDPDFGRASQVYRRAMASVGLKVDDEVAIRASQSASDAGRVLSEIQAAILRFRSNQITHLVFLLPDAGGSLFIIRAAQDQGASFRLGLSSNDLPQFLSTQPDISPETLRGAMVTGWIPQTDVVLDGQFPRTPGRARCEAVYRKHGVTFADQFAFAAGLSYCDSLLYLQAVLGTQKIPLTPTTFAERSTALRSGFPAAFTFEAALQPSRRWGAQLWRGAAYEVECDCFHYTSQARAFPPIA